MIKRLQFSKAINAKKDKIWEALWSDRSYRSWASVFAEGSYVVSNDWKKGSHVLFLGPDKNGIFSRIEEHIPNSRITFRHLGSVLNGKEQPIDDETKKWSGATETYFITEESDSYVLTIDLDIMDEHLEFMKERLPKALEIIHENCFR